jgi:hypothetical protein
MVSDFVRRAEQEERGLGEANGMYLSKPVMIRPSTSVVTRNETVHSVIVRYIHAQDLQATHMRTTTKGGRAAAGVSEVHREALRCWFALFVEGRGWR